MTEIGNNMMLLCIVLQFAIAVQYININIEVDCSYTISTNAVIALHNISLHILRRSLNKPKPIPDYIQ